MTIKEKEKLSDEGKIAAGYVLFRSIIEVLGKPPAHIEKTIKDYIAKLEQDEEITILTKEFSKAEKQEESLYSTFVEIEAWAKNMPKLFWFCFDYMPSSIEIIDPTTLTYKSNDFSDFLNDLQARLHQLDMVVKTARQESRVLTKNTNLVLQNSVMSHLIMKPRTYAFLQKVTGVPDDHFKPFLEGLEKLGKLTHEGEVYTAVLPKKGEDDDAR